VLARTAEAKADAPFVDVGTGWLSFGEVDREASRIARGLRGLGIEPRDRVAVMCDNRLEYLLALFGIARAGAAEVAVNTAFKGQILRHVLGHSDAVAIFVQAEYLPLVEAERAELPALRLVIVIGDHGDAGEGAATFAGLDGEDGEMPVVRAADVAAIGYTSGTTGRSKGALLPHNRIIHSAYAMAEVREVGAADTLYTCLPLFHGNAKYLTLLPALVAGARIAIRPRFSASGFWGDIAETQATQFNYLGVMISILAKQEPHDGETANTLRLGWGAGVPAELHEKFERRFDLTLLEGYGLTEGGIPLSSRRGARRIGSCGKPLPGYELEILDDDDEPVEPGEVGEIAIRGTQPFVTMIGYHKMAAETVACMRNYWLHTGDFGMRDEDGWFYFKDRKQDSIRRRGENISSIEVEEAILLHEAVLEVAAFPAPSEVGEDEVMVVVVLREGSDLTEEELVDHCRQQMPYFWVPRYVELQTEPLPRTPTNKITKAPLRGRGPSAGTWDRTAHEGAVKTRRH
jgi:crotonobetaine/carnitine-CoA ligase